jgi:flagellin
MASVNTNIGALVASNNMSKQAREMEQAMERLSSGLRLNSASDDAAGVSISERMNSQIKGLNQAIRNSQDAQNLIDTVEGANIEVVNILQRLRELAVQSANDTMSGLDRTFLADEATALIAEIDRIKDTTAYNGTKVLDGTFTSKMFQVGHKKDEEIAVSVSNVATSSIGRFELKGDTISDVVTDAASENTETSLTVDGFLGSAAAAVSAGSSAKQMAAAINEDFASTGVQATAVTFALINNLSDAGTVNFTLESDDGSASIVSNNAATNDLTALRDAINAKSGVTQVTATFESGSQGGVILKHATGGDIVLTNVSGKSAAATIDVHALDTDGKTEKDTGPASTAMNGTNDVYTVGTVTAFSTKAFTISGDDTDDAGFFDTTHGNSGATETGGTAAISNVASIAIGTQTGAEDAIAVLDGAIDQINQIRSDLGAVSNRLDKTINNLSNIVENTTASRSYINDADFAAETSALTKAQILNQAATSMLAQANASKQNILALLQNG